MVTTTKIVFRSFSPPISSMASFGARNRPPGRIGGAVSYWVEAFEPAETESLDEPFYASGWLPRDTLRNSTFCCGQVVNMTVLQTEDSCDIWGSLQIMSRARSISWMVWYIYLVLNIATDTTSLASNSHLSTPRRSNAVSDDCSQLLVESKTVLASTTFSNDSNGAKLNKVDRFVLGSAFYLDLMPKLLNKGEKRLFGGIIGHWLGEISGLAGSTGNSIYSGTGSICVIQLVL